MTDSEKLDLILSEMQEMKKQNSGMEARLESIESSITIIEKRIETLTNTYIQMIAEGR